jgi:hypothetical protein
MKTRAIAELLGNLNSLAEKGNPVLPTGYSAMREPRSDILHIARGGKAHPRAF